MFLDKIASLRPDVAAVMKNKGTERPFTGEYNDFGESGTYLCRECGLALFRSETKFQSACGWPSFDAEMANHVATHLDSDGRRTEIVCARCNGHLGHVFHGEQLTAQNTRHCVNSLSLDFVDDMHVTDTEEAIFAAGCFWGVEYYLKQLNGVLKTEVGYSGGKREHPTYEQICSGATGHYEVIRVLYDPNKISYTDLVKYFFEIHDPTQENGQGPDIGQQYLSVVFYYDANQKQIAERVVLELETMGLAVATKILPVSVFWKAETYHQDYYAKTGKTPYCHRYIKRF